MWVAGKTVIPLTRAIPERTGGGYDDALYKSTFYFTLLYFRWILTDVCRRRASGPDDCRCGAGIVEFGRRAAVTSAAAIAARAVISASAVVVVIGGIPHLTAQRCHVTRRTTVLHTAHNQSVRLREQPISVPKRSHNINQSIIQFICQSTNQT